jgi:hypothetical protein
LDAAGKLLFALLSLIPRVTDLHSLAFQRHAACHLLHYAVLAVFIKYPQNVALPSVTADKIINLHCLGKGHGTSTEQLVQPAHLEV